MSNLVRSDDVQSAIIDAVIAGERPIKVLLGKEDFINSLGWASAIGGKAVHCLYNPHGRWEIAIVVNGDLPTGEFKLVMSDQKL